MADHNFKESENRLNDYWDKNKIYSWDQNVSRENTFVIDTPPPTVSGTLHMGHIFSYTQTDFIARYKRMIGKNIYYGIGYDDNGLPTERLVEKLKNIRAIDIPRQEFIKICDEVVKEETNKFRQLFKSMAYSFDWSLEYHTNSHHSRFVSQLSFLDLFSKNCVYRQLQPTLWDPIDRTALAQADLVDKELESTMNHVIFTTTTNENIIIATTRPELIPAAVAIFYYPDDERYNHLAGQSAISPLFNCTIPILPDKNVAIDKGTGLVMCSTFGDTMDINWWREHKLPLRIIITKNGRISLDGIGSENWPSTDIVQAKLASEKIIGLSIKNARTKIVEMLKEKNLLVKEDAIMHNVKCAERSGSPVEILVTPQWFIKITDQKIKLLDKANECKWYPNFMKNKIDNWILGLNWDWCISRQRYFGIPFPIWYSKRKGEEGKILVAINEDLPVDPLMDLPRGYTRDEVEAETDVMDTWATSSVTPQINSWGICETNVLDKNRHKKLFPADLRPQAHEIIRTWAFYTIVKAHLHENCIPWHNLMISGWCLAEVKKCMTKPTNEKMSKSKGNIVSPVDLIDKYGADVVRYWASSAGLGMDIVYSEKNVSLGKRLVTKLWNAAKFVSIHISQLNEKPLPMDKLLRKEIYETMDLWLIAKLIKTVDYATKEFEKFEYNSARAAIEYFFWHDFCDNYLEIIKNRVYSVRETANLPAHRDKVYSVRETANLPALQDKVYDTNNKGKMSAVYTLYYALDTIVKLFAPFMPYITEEIYQKYLNNNPTKSVHMCGSWPNFKHIYVGKDFELISKTVDSFKFIAYLDDYFENIGNAAISILNSVRKIKSDSKMSHKFSLSKLQINYIGIPNKTSTITKVEDLLSIIPDLTAVTNCKIITFDQIGSLQPKILTDNGLFEIAYEI